MAVALVVALAGCSRQPDQARGGPHCVDLAAVVADRMMEQPAVASLPRAAQAELIESLRVPGQLCLSSGAVAVSCNAGGARAPDVRRCCKFSQPPQATVTGLPTRLAIRADADPASHPTVALELQGVVEDLSLDQRCEVPTCEADRASARPLLHVTGTLVNDDSTTEIDVRIDLGRDVELTCNVPGSADDAT